MGRSSPAICRVKSRSRVPSPSRQDDRRALRPDRMTPRIARPVFCGHARHLPPRCDGRWTRGTVPRVRPGGLRPHGPNRSIATSCPTPRDDNPRLHPLSPSAASRPGCPTGASRPRSGRVFARRATSLAPRIVVLGGGFAGVTTALELAKRCAGVLPVDITLISDRNFFLFTPMLAEAATGAVETRHVLHPIRPLCTAAGIEFGEMRVEAIDLARRRLTVRHSRSRAHQEIRYDRLVLALGAAPNVGMAPGAAEHALTFKGAGDAVQIRNRVIDLFEAAALTDDPWVRAAPAHLRRGRGGPRGHGADGGPRGADPRDSPPPLPLHPGGRRAPGPGRERDPAADGDQPRHLRQGAAPRAGHRAGADRGPPRSPRRDSSSRTAG